MLSLFAACAAYWGVPALASALPPLWAAALAAAGGAAVALLWDVLLRRQVEARVRALSVCDQRRRDAELQQAMDAADAATEEKSRFLANISHEIRTPLHGIIAFTELAWLKKQPLPRDHQRSILDLSYALLDIVSNTLSFAKLEAGEEDMEVLPFQLDRLLLRVWEMTMRGSPSSELECILDVAPDTPMLLAGDAGRLQQVLANLMNNAVKYTPPGGRVCLCVRHSPPRPASLASSVVSGAVPAQFRFFVRDTGGGIDPDQLPRLFRPFAQADSSLARHYGGTGLGLSIARHMVEKMGGEIWVESEMGKGSTFAFSVPLLVRGEADDADDMDGFGGGLRRGYGEDPQNGARETHPPFEGLQVLVVNASAEGMRVMRRTLEWLGVQCRAYVARPSGPLSVLGQLEYGKIMPDVIIMDRLLGEGGTPPTLRLALELQLRCVTPAPLLLVGGLREELMAAALKDKPYPLEIIPAVTVAGMRAALHRLLGHRMASVPEAETLVAAPTPDLSSLSILVVDDNAVNQKVMALLLEESGARLHMAGGGAEALALLETESVDLIFLDIQMPGMDGHETLRRMRAMGCTAPVAAITAHAMRLDRQRCLEAGMDAYLPKPFRRALLFDTIRALLPQRHFAAMPRAREGRGNGHDCAARTDNARRAELPACFSREIIAAAGLSPAAHAEVLESFARTHIGDAASLRRMAGEGRWQELREGAHSLKGAAANVGAVALRDAARALELRALERGRRPSAADLFSPPDLPPDLPPNLPDVAEALDHMERALDEVLRAAPALPATSGGVAREVAKPVAPVPSPSMWGSYCDDLEQALKLAFPGRIRLALNSLLTLCREDDPQCVALRQHVRDYDYEKALKMLGLVRACAPISAPTSVPAGAPTGAPPMPPASSPGSSSVFPSGSESSPPSPTEVRHV